MSVHERPVGATVEWRTPPELFRRLGLVFDMDPAGAPDSFVPAFEIWTANGLDGPWHGRVWLNPPYGPAARPFVERMIAHGDGLLLLPARTETRLFQEAAQAADAVCFLRDRLHFIRADGYQGRSSFGSVLMAFGDACYDALMEAGLGWTATGPVVSRFTLDPRTITEGVAARW